MIALPKVNSNGINFKALEGQFHLDEFIRLELEGQNIGVYLLKKKNQYRAIFLFRCKGIPPYIAEEDIHNYVDPLELGVRNLLNNEVLTFHQKFFRTYRKYKKEILKSAGATPTRELKFLELSKLKRIEEITEKGYRQEAEIIITCSYTPSSKTDQDKDKLDKFIEKLNGFYDEYLGGKVKEQEDIFNVITNCYDEGYRPWYNILRENMGLEVEPLTDTEAYIYLRERFNLKSDSLNEEEREFAETIPQVIVYDGENVTLEQNSSLHPVSKILNELPDIPIRTRKYIKINDDYIGILTFTDKPTGVKNKREKIKFLWNLFNRIQTYDNEVFVQISLGDKSFYIEEQEKVTKQSIDDQKHATKKGEVDIQAEIRLEAAVKAQKDLYDNVELINVTGCILVYRDDPDKLDKDCTTMQSYVQKPFSLYKENTYAFRTWLQTIPILWERMLRVPYDRYQPYKSSEMGFMMPLVLPQAAGNKGLEFIADSGIPIYYDTERYRSHTLILGTQGSSKSVTVAHLVAEQRAKGIPVFIFDMPKADGYSSHQGLCEFLGTDAAYINVAREKINIFELPDLSKIQNAQDKEVKRNEFKDFLIEIMTKRVMYNERTISSETVKSILTLAIEKFFSKEQNEIRRRIDAAQKGGIGSPAWQEYPTIKDFIPFISLERLNIKNPTPELRQAVKFIQLKLESWIKSSVGRLISEPSTIDTKAGLLVYSLTGVSNKEDMEIILMAASMEVKRKSIAYPICTVLYEEISQSMQYDTNVNVAADNCLNGGKAGIQVVLVGQTIAAIEESSRAADILGNINNRLIGFIQSSEVKRLTSTFDYPPDLLRRNSAQSFAINPQDLCSSWLIETEGQRNFVKFYANPVILGLTANENAQVKLRQEIMAGEQDKIDGCLKTASAIVNNLQK